MTTTPTFPVIRKALALFADHDWAAADRLLQRVIQEPGKGEALRRELELAERDAGTDWGVMVSNESYELTDADDPEAKDLVLLCLWDAANPDEPARNTDTTKYRIYAHDTNVNDGSFAANIHVGVQFDGHLEKIDESKQLATISRIKRTGNVLEVTFEPLGSTPLPSTLRKLIRTGLQEFLRNTPAVAGEIAFHDLKSKATSKLRCAGN